MKKRNGHCWYTWVAGSQTWRVRRHAWTARKYSRGARGQRRLHTWFDRGNRIITWTARWQYRRARRQRRLHTWITRGNRWITLAENEGFILGSLEGVAESLGLLEGKKEGLADNEGFIRGLLEGITESLDCSRIKMTGSRTTKASYLDCSRESLNHWDCSREIGIVLKWEMDGHWEEQNVHSLRRWYRFQSARLSRNRWIVRQRALWCMLATHGMGYSIRRLIGCGCSDSMIQDLFRQIEFLWQKHFFCS